MERTQPQPDRSGGQSVQSRSPAASSSSGAAGLLKQTESQISSSTEPETLPRIEVADLPPLPESVGLNRLLQQCFGAPLRPLRVLWPVARWLWLAVGLIVIGAAAIDYLSDLFTGGLPDVTGSFFHSPVLEIPSRYPHRFMAAAAAALFLTVLTWGAAREQRRLVNARAKQVGQLLRAGVVLEQLDEDVFARLAAGDFYATFLLATHLHEQNRPEDAAALYHLLLKKTPKHFGVHYNLGLICAESGRFEAAEDHCRTAILLSPESAEAQGLLAYVLYRLGDLAEAQRRARLAVRMGFSSKSLEALILPGLGITNSLPTVETGEGQ